MTALAHRDWVPAHCEKFAQKLARKTSGQDSKEVAAAIEQAIALNQAISEADYINLDPATNVMIPRAERSSAWGLGSPVARLSGRQVRDGTEGVEQVEVIAAELAAEVFGAPIAEFASIGSDGKSLRLHGDATAGDRIIAPPGSDRRARHHHLSGAAVRIVGESHDAPVDAKRLQRGPRRPESETG